MDLVSFVGEMETGDYLRQEKSLFYGAARLIITRTAGIPSGMMDLVSFVRKVETGYYLRKEQPLFYGAVLIQCKTYQMMVGWVSSLL